MRRTYTGLQYEVERVILLKFQDFLREGIILVLMKTYFWLLYFLKKILEFFF